MERPENYDALPEPVKRQYDAAIAKQAAMGGETETNEPQEKDDGGQGQGQTEALLGSEAKQDAPAVDWRTEYQKQAALNAEMQRRLMMMEAQVQQSQPQGQPQEVVRRTDLIDLEGMQDLPDEVVAAFKALNDELLAVKNGQAQVQRQAATLGQQSFAQALDAAVPGWQAKNSDPGWLKWLEQADPMSGFVRQQLLDRAADSMDVGRVASIFNSYFGQQQSAPAKPKRSAGLADLATPGSSRTTVAVRDRPGMSVEELRIFNKRFASDSEFRNSKEAQQIVKGLGSEIPVH